MTAKAPMKRDQQIKLMITLFVLLPTLLFTFTKNVLMRKKNVSPPSAAVSTQDESKDMADQLIYVTNLRMYDALRDKQRAVWEKEWTRDPFVPQEAIASIVKAVNLTLKGVLWDESNPKAIVNEKTLFKGDTIYGYTVVDIKPRSVILRTGEKHIELSVFHPVAADPSLVNR